MTKNKTLFFSLFIATATFLLAGSNTVWAGSISVNLLLLGDSITEQGMYVSPLKTLLATKGYTAANVANEGRGGYIIEGDLAGAPTPGLLENINTYMNHSWANSANTYILLMIGTNDVAANYKLGSSDSPNVQTRLGRLISAIETIAPKAHLIVAEIVPNFSNQVINSRTPQFNKDVAASVATAKALGKNVSLVDMYTAFTPSQYAPYTTIPNPYMKDGIHPNQKGGDLMAQVWFNGIQATQVPEPSTLTMLGVALLGLLACVWRRSRRRAVAA